MTADSQASQEQLDRAALLERVEGDQELLAEMIHLFLDDAPHCSRQCAKPSNKATCPCWNDPPIP